MSGTDTKNDEAVEGQVVSPADVVDEEAPAPEGDPIPTGDAPQQAVAPRQSDLTIRSANLNELSAAQQDALKAILNFKPNESPVALNNVTAFLHLCKSRGLDPFAREVYLIARGAKSNRTYTMQTGIDGYRKIAQRTGRWIGVVETTWTGQDDDEQSWRPVPDDDGDVVMRRVWYDQWPVEQRGYPGACRVTVAYYDDQMVERRTKVVADWGMYAPMTPVYVGRGDDRKIKRGPDGKPVMELGEFWRKGPAHMLAKVAEALAIRRTLAGAVSGMYTHEEMHRADYEERQRKAEAARSRVVEAAQSVVNRDTAPAKPEQAEAPPKGAPVDAEEVPDEEEPVVSPLMDDDEEPDVEDGPVADFDPLLAARVEAKAQAEVLGVDVREHLRRQVDAAGVSSAAELTVGDLAQVVWPARRTVVRVLVKAGREEVAKEYGAHVDSGEWIDPGNLPRITPGE